MIDIQAYIDKNPEIILEWHDSETEAVGWVVINSLRNGAAGGGTRMRKGLTQDEVVALAKVMEVKFSVSGPAIGGAKSGINFDPDDPRRDEVLNRWFKTVFPLLKNYYGTGGDLNVDEIKDVIPITEQLGLWHPQEGVVNGHFDYNEGQKVHALGQLRFGCAKIIEDGRFAPVKTSKLAIADMITGYGVVEAVMHYYNLSSNTSLEGKKVIIQGWGNVASAAGYYLSQNGALIVGISDRDGGLIEEDGMSFSRIKELFQNKNGNKLNDEKMIPFSEINQRMWDVPCDVFIPGAASRLVKRGQVNRMIANGIEVIACGANVPFIDDKIFFGPTAEYADKHVALIPDFIANCGMARTFAYLMEGEREVTDENIFNDVSDTIRNALKEVIEQVPKGKSITKTAFGIAMKKIN